MYPQNEWGSTFNTKKPPSLLSSQRGRKKKHKIKTQKHKNVSRSVGFCYVTRIDTRRSTSSSKCSCLKLPSGRPRSTTRLIRLAALTLLWVRATVDYHPRVQNQIKNQHTLRRRQTLDKTPPYRHA